MGIRGNKIIQFVEKEKRLKKGVDKRRRVWYYNKAVARESERDRKASNDTKRKAFVFGVFERKFKNEK